jgi:hypothetical protein
MEFVLGYLIGSGANWPTILVTLILVFVIAVLANIFFGVK